MQPGLKLMAFRFQISKSETGAVTNCLRSIVTACLNAAQTVQSAELHSLSAFFLSANIEPLVLSYLIRSGNTKDLIRPIYKREESHHG
jgi:hypothetical protein